MPEQRFIVLFVVSPEDHKYVIGPLDVLTFANAKPSQADGDEFCDTYIEKVKSQYWQLPSSVFAIGL